MHSPPPPTPSHQGRESSTETHKQSDSKLPYFSRSQLGIILILAATLLGLYAWRAHWLFPPSPPPPGIMHVTFVEVTGPVAHPGIYSFAQPPSLQEIWRRAGAPGAAPDQNITIPSGSRLEVRPDGGYYLGVMSGKQLLTLGLPIDLNRAGVADLAAVPGIGPVLGKRILAYREAHGPFHKVEDLDKVSGFGKKKVGKVKPFLIVKGQKEPQMNADKRR
jgi:competence ComEA-like helix-hairpin-helix protein